jgi:hypothetical protein
MLRHADAVGARGVHDHDAAARGCRNVDVIDAGSGAGNHPKPWRGGDERFVDLGRASYDERVRVDQIFRQVGGRSLRACIDCPAWYGSKDFNR